MKRHIHTLLQRKRVEFEGGSDRARSQPEDGAGMTVVEVKDGYDWLRVIKQTTRNQHAPSH